MVLYCDSCNVLVEAIEVAEYFVHQQLAPTLRLTLQRCPACESPFLTQQAEEFDDWSDPERLYPPAASRIGSALPKPILASLEEAASCFRAKAFTASAIMCRKTLEGICAAHQVKDGSLASRLRKLKENGVIDARLFEWADELRLSGNEAAHDVHVQVSSLDASEILDFTHALLEYVFTFRERFEVFKKRRESRAATA